MTGLYPPFFDGTEEQDPVGWDGLDIFSIEGSAFIHRSKSIDGGSFNISNVKSTLNDFLKYFVFSVKSSPQFAPLDLSLK